MNPTNRLPHEHAGAQKPHLATDPITGCLYDVRARELSGRVPEEFRTGMEALAAVRLVGRLMHLHMERWAERFGLSEGRMQVMFRLLKTEGNALAMNQLASELNVSPRNVTGLVDTLEKQGLVERRPDPNDRRSIQAAMTPEGKRLLSNLWEDTIARQSPLITEFTEDELATLRQLCLRFVRHMERQAEEEARR